LQLFRNGEFIMAPTYVYNLVDGETEKYSQILRTYMSTGEGSLAPLTKAFYARYGDDYDFIFFLLVSPANSGLPSRFYEINRPENLGAGVSGYSSSYVGPMDVRLTHGPVTVTGWTQSTAIPTLSGVVAAPLVVEASNPPHFNRELLKNWGIFIAGLTRFGVTREQFGWCDHSVKGVGGGFDVTTLKDANGVAISDPLTVAKGAAFQVASYSRESSPVDRAYAPMELWLMGLAPKTEVPAFYGIKEYATTVSDSNGVKTMKGGGFLKITADDIVTAHTFTVGTVKTSYEPTRATKTNFRAAWVVVSETAASATAMAKAERYAKAHGGIMTDTPDPGCSSVISFAQATGNRATMASELIAPALLPLEIHPNNRYAIVTVPQATFDGWYKQRYNTNAIRANEITRTLYAKFKDDFDFIAFMIDVDKPADGTYGQLYPISNAVSGIGKGIYSNSGSFGSGGKLKAHFTIWARDGMERGPFLHEVCHQWANDAFVTHAVRADGVPVLEGKNNGSHWAYSGCGGQLGGFDQSTLETNVDGDPNKYRARIGTRTTFGVNANGGNGVPFSNFELYLMGMIPAAEITPFDVFSGLSVASTTDSAVFCATTRTTYDKDKIVGLLGPRVPSCADAQKSYKVLVVVLTASGISATNQKVIDDMLERQSRASSDGTTSYNFWEATGGRGTLSFDLSQSIK
jgi:hypothetical protein